MKSPHANPSELQALNAVPRAPFPLTPAAAAAKPASAIRLAALKRLEEEEEKNLTDSVPAEGEAMGDAIAEDGLTSEGAALEAIAPAPLPEATSLDTLLAQAGPVATGGGAAGGSGIPMGAIIGGAVVLVAAAASGGGGEAAAPAPAPAGPPNQPASINASAPQRTGFVIEDYAPADEEMYDGYYEYTGTTGNTEATALKITDADGGADLTFREATAEELQGKYGVFTFDAANGLWTYTIDNNDPDTQALGSGGGRPRLMKGRDDYSEAYDYLTVYSKDGTASTVIEVGVIGKGEPPVLGGDTGVTVGAGDMVLIDLSAMSESGSVRYDYWDGPSSSDGFQFYNEGGFALYFADGDFETPYSDSFTYRAYSNADGGRATGDVTVNIVAPGSTGGDEASPSYGWGNFRVEATEGEPSSIYFDGEFSDADDDGSGIFTIVLDASSFYDDGHFVMGMDESVRILGNGTTEVALQGTLAALHNYFDGGLAQVVINSEYVNSQYEAGYIDFKAYLYDEQGNGAGYRDIYLDDFEAINDLPAINTYTTEDMPQSNPVYYVPATGTADAGSTFLLGDSNVRIQLEDEEAWNDSSGDGDWVYLTLSVDAGTLSLLEVDDSTLFSNYGNVAIRDGMDNWVSGEDASDLGTGVTTIELRGEYYALSQAVNRYLGYQGPESFAAGSQATLTLEFEDAGGEVATQEIPLVASVANTGPFFSITGDFSFPDFTIVTAGEGEDGPASRMTTATATLNEDQHLTLTGIAVNDFESTGASKVALNVSAYEFYMFEGERQSEGRLGVFYIDDAWQDLVDYNYGGRIALTGSIDDINAMFAEGGLHYALPPDYDANRVSGEDDQYVYDMGFNIEVSDLGSPGYGAGSALLQMDINLAAVNDVPLVLAEATRNVSNDYEGDSISFNYEDLLDPDVVFDAEYNGNGAGGTLDITSLVLVAGTGSGTLSFDEEEDEWTYLFGEDDMPGDVVEFTYGFTDGTYSGSNTLNLILEEGMVV